jgi:hypothetical protein
MRQISQRFVFDSAFVTVGPPKQVGFVDFAFVMTSCCGYMYWALSAWHASYLKHTRAKVKKKVHYLVATLQDPEIS